MDIQNKEVWDRLENESERAYRAFEVFLRLPSSERTLTAAYQHHVSNPDARPSDTWNRWSNEFAWRERAAAYDDHLSSVRREAHEQVIKEEAAQQAREVEKVRGRFNELLTGAFMLAMEALEDKDWVRDNLRSSDVLNITRLHLDALKALEVDRDPRDIDDWDEAALEEIVKEVDDQTDLESPDDEEEDGEDSENTESDLE